MSDFNEVLDVENYEVINDDGYSNSDSSSLSIGSIWNGNSDGVISEESVGEDFEEEYIESSYSFGSDLSAEENNSYNFLLEEIEKLQSNTELVDYSESLGLIVEKLDTIIFQNQDLHYYQLTIIDNLLYFKYFSYALIVVFVIIAFSRFLGNVLFKYL